MGNICYAIIGAKTETLKCGEYSSLKGKSCSSGTIFSFSPSPKKKEADQLNCPNQNYPKCLASRATPMESSSDMEMNHTDVTNK